MIDRYLLLAQDVLLVVIRSRSSKGREEYEGLSSRRVRHLEGEVVR